MACPGLPGPSSRKRARSNDSGAKAPCDFCCPVGRCIIDNNHLRRLLALLPKRLQQRRKILLLIARRNDHGRSAASLPACRPADRHTPDQQKACENSGQTQCGQPTHVHSALLWFTIILATCWPHSVTIGMPPPGLTLPPTKKRLRYRGLCFGALNEKLRIRSHTTP